MWQRSQAKQEVHIWKSLGVVGSESLRGVGLGPSREMWTPSAG